MKVLDPACGSGHFLLAAARRLGKELARVRTGEDEPAPERVREAIRDVVAHCIYGVDKNPLAVELCRVALWLEAHCAGKPLTFLDHRIRCGDSLVGVFDLGVLKEGIPDKAYEPLEGDDKGVAAAVKRRNRGERAGQLTLPFDRLADTLQKHAREALDLNKIPDESVDAIEEKAHRYNAIRRSQLAIRQAADLWCAAFFQPLEPNKPVITTGAVADHLAGRPIDGRLTGLAAAIAFHQRFFHWPLEFPEVFSANGESRIVNEERKAEGPSPFPMSHSPSTGFDVVLSNPPWERIKLQEQEFFAARDRRIAEAPTKAARARLIRELPQTNPALYAEYRDALRAAEAASQFLRYGGRFPLTGRGDINTYAVFAELARSALKASGRAGIIVPTGIATDDTTKFFFQEVVQTGSLASLYDFENRKGIFPSVHKSYKFCLLTLRHSPFPIRRHSTPAEFVFFALGTEDLRRPEKRFTLTAEEIALLNPNTGNCPIFRTQADAELTKAIYRRVPVLLREASSEQRVASSGRGRDYLPDRANGQSRIANGGREAEDHLPLATHHSPGNPWRLSFKTLFHMANDSHHFRTAADLEAEGFRLAGNVFVKGDPPFATRYLPLYEAKMLHQFDHRWATYESQRGASGEWRVETRDVTDAEKADPNFVVQPRYWVREDVLEAAIPKYPEPLAEALRDGQRESVRLVLALWAAGHHLARGEERSARHMLSTIPHSPFAIRHSPFPIRHSGTDREQALTLARDYPLDAATLARVEAAALDASANPTPLAAELVERFSPKWFLGWRDICRSTDERTLIASVVPKAGIGHTYPLALTERVPPLHVVALLASLNSFAVDYVARQKVGGTHITFGLLKQFPIVSPAYFVAPSPLATRDSPLAFILPRTLELLYTAHDLDPLARDLGYDGPPFRWDPERRFEIRCELDAAFFHLYLPCDANGEWRAARVADGHVVDETPEQLAALKRHFPTPRDAVAYILDQFPIVRQKDEARFGRYRTKERILAIYDAMLEAQRTGATYRSPLDPPPGKQEAPP